MESEYAALHGLVWGKHPSARCFQHLEENTVAGQETTQSKTASQSLKKSWKLRCLPLTY